MKRLIKAIIQATVTVVAATCFILFAMNYPEVAGGLVIYSATIFFFYTMPSSKT